jgi:hypothetical protein
MKRVIFVIAFLLAAHALSFAAGDAAKSKEESSKKVKPDTIFQKIGDFITGDYDVHGKPLKEVGVLQATADEIQKMKAGGR